MTIHIPEPFGPEYPQLGATVAKFRKKAPHSIFDLSKAERNNWAAAIEKEILAKQRQALQRELPTHNVDCASGTNHSCGLKISAAVRAQHRAALLAWPAQERAKRSDAAWKSLYEQAMKLKRARMAS